MLMNPLFSKKWVWQVEEFGAWINLSFEALSTSEKQTVTITNRTSQKVPGIVWRLVEAVAFGKPEMIRF